MIVALPVGIVFFIFSALYYYASTKDETPCDSTPVTACDPNLDSDPDFQKLFDTPNFIREQENLR